MTTMHATDAFPTKLYDDGGAEETVSLVADAAHELAKRRAFHSLGTAGSVVFKRSTGAVPGAVAFCFDDPMPPGFEMTGGKSIRAGMLTRDQLRAVVRRIVWALPVLPVLPKD